MTCSQADTLLYFLHEQKEIVFTKVYDRTADVSIKYVGEKNKIINVLQNFGYEKVIVPKGVIETSGRKVNNTYQEKLIFNVIYHFSRKLFLPSPIRNIYTIYNGLKYLKKGLVCLWNRRIDVPVLDATAIGVSILRGDMNTAGSVMFMLGFGELMEEWTHKKSVDDLARSMSLNVSKVWLKKDYSEILISSDDVKEDDEIIVRVSNTIPFDGIVTNGEAMINQASLTGESVPIRKTIDSYAYAGTVVEEGELVIKVKSVGGSSKFEKIVTMIEESEKLKSAVESKASHLADKLVPYSLLGTGLTWLLTGNKTKALSILMVDYSCALKLAMPISVLSAIREASMYNITVKGGKYMEAIAEADTIVFDKTGTLTKAKPTVIDVVSFNGKEKNELLKTAACLEEHFPHSMANAVVEAAKNQGLEHEELHSKVEYVVAHGIASTINGKKVIIGSYHFVFEDEKTMIVEGKQELFDSLPNECTHLYLAVEGILEAVICIKDPLRPEALAVINSLKKSGISKVVMMTGDSERTAKVIANQVGVDEYYSEVLPEDKAKFVEKEKSLGRKVIMVGDGINDSPALSSANVGIAISDGAEIAREIADVTVGSDDLYQIVTLKLLSNALMCRIHKNYRNIVVFNSMLIGCGVFGLLPPTTSALLHNLSTLYISTKSMGNLIK